MKIFLISLAVFMLLGTTGLVVFLKIGGRDLPSPEHLRVITPATKTRVLDRDGHLIGEFYRDFWSAFPDYFGIFWAISNQSTIGDLPGPLLDEVKELWEPPLRLLEGIVREGVARGELCSCDPWVMANVIWNMGNCGFSAMVTPDKARLVDCEAKQMYDAGLDLLLRGLTTNTPA